jgi:hypothetical protein
MKDSIDAGAPLEAPLAPPRLAEQGSEYERQILGSARLDAVPACARARVAAALGDVLAPRVGEMPNAGQSGRTEAQGNGHDSNGPATLGRHGVAALIGMGLVGAGLGAFWLLSSSRLPAFVSAHSETGAALQMSALSTPKPSPSASLDVTLQEGFSERSALTPGAPVEPRAPAVRAPSAASRRVDEPRRTGHAPQAEPQAPAGGGLLEEVRALDRVRASLGAGQTSQATRQLDLYRRTFPRGELTLESDVLGIDVALAAGKREHALALAHVLLMRPSASRYHARLRTLLAEANGSNPELTHIKGRR